MTGDVGSLMDETVAPSLSVPEGRGKIAQMKREARARKVLRSLERRLGRRGKGLIVAIEPISGDSFTGRDDSEALKKALRKHPRATFQVFRIGFDYVHRFRSPCVG